MLIFEQIFTLIFKPVSKLISNLHRRPTVPMPAKRISGGKAKAEIAALDMEAATIAIPIGSLMSELYFD